MSTYNVHATPSAPVKVSLSPRTTRRLVVHVFAHNDLGRSSLECGCLLVRQKPLQFGVARRTCWHLIYFFQFTQEPEAPTPGHLSQQMTRNGVTKKKS